MSLVRVDELIRALKGCSNDAKVFISIDEEGNEYKPLDTENIKGMYSAPANEHEWEMVKEHLTDRKERIVVLFPVG